MFVVDEDCNKLSKEKSETFHKLVASILFATKNSTSGYLYSNLLPDDKSKRSRSKQLDEYVTSVQLCKRQ